MRPSTMETKKSRPGLQMEQSIAQPTLICLARSLDRLGIKPGECVATLAW